jgi:hypothetical protein
VREVGFGNVYAGYFVEKRDVVGDLGSGPACKSLKGCTDQVSLVRISEKLIQVALIQGCVKQAPLVGFRVEFKYEY